MGGIDKLLAPVAGRPVLAWTLGALAASPVVARIVVVASAADIGGHQRRAWVPRSASARSCSVASVARSRWRQASRRCEDGTDLDRSDRVVLVHDGARPLVSGALIAVVAMAAERHGAAIPVVPVAETVKRVASDLVAETVDRAELVTAQTPQGVRRGLLRACLRAVPARRTRDMDR